MINTLAPELRIARPGHLDAAKLPALRSVIQIGDTTAPGTIPFESVVRHGRRRRIARGWRNWRGGCSSTSRSTSSSPPARPALPKGATLTHHNILNNGYLPRRGDALHRAGQGVHPGAAVSLLRHGDRQSGLHDAWRGDGVSRRGLRSAGDAADRGGGALHVAVRRADHVHRRTGSSGVREVRSDQPAHRHDGGRALSDRGDAPLHPRHASDAR